MEPNNAPIVERAEAWIRSATRRITSVTGLITAVLGLAAAIIVICSSVTALANQELVVQIPLGPKLSISAFVNSDEGKETTSGQTDDGAASAAPVETTSATGGSTPKGPRTLEATAIQVVPTANGMCVFGYHGSIQIYPSNGGLVLGMPGN